MKYLIIFTLLFNYGCQNNKSKELANLEPIKIEELIKLIGQPISFSKDYMEKKHWIFSDIQEELISEEYKKRYTWRRNDNVLSDIFFVNECDNGNICMIRMTINDAEFKTNVPNQLKKLDYDYLGSDVRDKTTIHSYTKQIEPTMFSYIELTENDSRDSLRYQVVLSSVNIPEKSIK